MKQESVAPLSQEAEGSPPPDRPRPRIKLSRNGPLLVTVDVLTNSKGERLSGALGIALCRCGASRNKPFCDSSHIRIGFSDDRAPDRTPAGGAGHDQPEADAASAPSIRISRNGPYEVQGFDLDTGNWPEGASRERFFLCRCGGSNNKPFCDGTHRRIDFQDDRN
jgi:CDGSH-type Zn-finger protein